MAGTAADSLVALTNVVVRAAFPNVTVAPDRNPVPFTVRVKTGPPAVAELGLRLEIVGRGLIVNVASAAAPRHRRTRQEPRTVHGQSKARSACCRRTGTQARNRGPRIDRERRSGRRAT